MTPEQQRVILMVEHCAFLARGIAQSADPMPDWIHVDAQRIADKAQAAVWHLKQLAAGYTIPVLPGFEEVNR